VNKISLAIASKEATLHKQFEAIALGLLAIDKETHGKMRKSVIEEILYGIESEVNDIAFFEQNPWEATK
jgi:hypothetical protein